MLVFYARHVCRLPEWPEAEKKFAAIEEDPTVYGTMNGPSEFHVIGSLREWNITDRLGEIDVPTLLVWRPAAFYQLRRNPFIFIG